MCSERIKNIIELKKWEIRNGCNKKQNYLENSEAIVTKKNYWKY